MHHVFMDFLSGLEEDAGGAGPRLAAYEKIFLSQAYEKMKKAKEVKKAKEKRKVKGHKPLSMTPYEISESQKYRDDKKTVEAIWDVCMNKPFSGGIGRHFSVLHLHTCMLYLHAASALCTCMLHLLKLDRFFPVVRGGLCGMSPLLLQEYLC